MSPSLIAPALPRMIDIGSNLTDEIFRGHYYGKKVHQDDFVAILDRARKAGVVCQILTGDSLEGSKRAIALAQEHAGLYATVGCHPCSAKQFDEYPGGPEAYLDALEEVIEKNLGGMKGKGKVVAVGETGLDYDRLTLCDKETQLRHFPRQLELATRFDLPLFLHCRHPEAHRDFVDIVKAHPSPTPLRGVVHSHSGSLEEALEMISLGFFIGINGCSLKTAENIECVRQLPLESLMIESDCPWCEIRPSHASFPLLASLATSPTHSHLKPLYMPPAVKKEKWKVDSAVKGRNEPMATGQVAWIIAQLKGVELEVVTGQAWKNSVSLFGLREDELAAL